MRRYAAEHAFYIPAFKKRVYFVTADFVFINAAAFKKIDKAVTAFGLDKGKRGKAVGGRKAQLFDHPGYVAHMWYIEHIPPAHLSKAQKGKQQHLYGLGRTDFAYKLKSGLPEFFKSTGVCAEHAFVIIDPVPSARQVFGNAKAYVGL